MLSRVATWGSLLRQAAEIGLKALSQATGKTTKELILDRVMVEAARLLRFTDLTVGQIAAQVGFTDPLYFSRAFKRQRGESPQAFREKSMHP